MRAEIRPSRAKGVICAPPSKSMAHRYLICAGLAEGESVVRNLAYSEDIKATIACLRTLGADIRLEGSTAYVKGVDVVKPHGMTAILPCNESGSTLRFFIPICMLSGEERVLTGSARLMQRPLKFYELLAESQKLSFEKKADRVIARGPLHSSIFKCSGDISSQYYSGMLFALPLRNKTSILDIALPVESSPYIDMTISALKEFGIHIRKKNNTEDNKLVLTVPGRIENPSAYNPADVTVEGDWSNAAFFEALNYAGSDVAVQGLRKDSLQGDKVCSELFEKLGDHKVIDINGIDISDCPDLGPALFAVAALCEGGYFTGTRRLKIKESDRGVAMKHELAKVGIRVDVRENSVIVHPGELRAPAVPIDGHNDHRIVMAMAILLTVTGGVIDGAEAVNKSFPDFFDRLKELGVDLDYGMDQPI